MKKKKDELEYDEFDETPKKPEKKKKKKSKLKRVLLAITMVVLFGVGLGCFYVTYLLNQVNRAEIDDSNENLGIDSTVPKSKEVVNIALFGIDSRSDQNIGLSDAIMIASIDSKHNKVKITSIMRDSQVEIDGYGQRKINSAYNHGGAELAIKTLNRNFKLNITDYVTVNFYQLANVIDILGGIEVDVTEGVRKNANKYIREVALVKGAEPQLIEKAGYQKLTGSQAVGYARVRYVGNADFQRTERQREVMQKLFEKVLATNPIKYPDLLNRLLPMVETSLNNSEILSIGTGLLLGGKPEFVQARFPEDGKFTSNGSNLVYDLDAAAEKLHAFIYDDIDFYASDTDQTEDKAA